MEKRYKINEVAKILGIAPSAIRFYEKKGLFHAKKDERNGYRYYEIDDINRISTIIYHRNIDMSIETINDFKNSDSLRKKWEMIQQQKDAIEAKIAEETRTLKIWNFYEKLLEQTMAGQDVLLETITTPFHLFHRSFLNNAHSSIYVVCHPVTVFSNEGNGLPDVSIYTIVHEEYIDLLTDDDRIKEKESIPPFPCLYTIIQDSSDYDDAHVLKKALKLANDQGYAVQPPYYVVYLLSSGGWNNNQRHYEVFMSKI